jgi:hypothetical protein
LSVDTTIICSANKLLELGVLGLKPLQLLRVRHFHAAKLGTPLVEGQIAETVLATQILCPKPSLMLLQNTDDLFSRGLLLLHRPSPLKGTD